MKNVLAALAKIVLLLLGLTAAASKENFGVWDYASIFK